MCKLVCKTGTPEHRNTGTPEHRSPKLLPIARLTDKDGTLRPEIRTRWWLNPLHATYRRLSIEPLPQLPDQPIDLTCLANSDHYLENDKAVFFGHYWLKGTPSLLTPNICCLDYSVAKGGLMVGYQHEQDESLDSGKMVGV